MRMIRRCGIFARRLTAAMRMLLRRRGLNVHRLLLWVLRRSGQHVSRLAVVLQFLRRSGQHVRRLTESLCDWCPELLIHNSCQHLILRRCPHQHLCLEEILVLPPPASSYRTSHPFSGKSIRRSAGRALQLRFFFQMDIFYRTVISALFRRLVFDCN